MKKLPLILLLFVCSVQALYSVDKTIDLSGKWNFAIDRDEKGIAEKWFAKPLTDHVILPGSMVENLKGDNITLETKFTGSIYDSSWFYNPKMEKYRKLDNLKMPFWLTQAKHYVGLAWYQKEVVVPKDWKGS